MKIANYTVKLKLLGKNLLSILIPTFIISLLIGGSSFYFAANAVQTHAQQELIERAAYQAAKIETKVESDRKAVISLADVIGAGAKNDEEIRSLMKTVKARNKEVLNIFAGFEADGKLIDALNTPKEKLSDPRTRDWYTVAVDDAKAVCSEVYHSKTTNKDVFAVSFPLKNNGQRIGVISATFDVEQILTNKAKEIKSYETGYAIILDKKGHFVYHPEYKVTDDIFTIQNGAISELGKEILDGKAHTLTFKSNGENNLYVSQPIGDTGFTLIIQTPEKEIMAEVYHMAFVNFLISLFGLLLLSVVVYVVIKKIKKLLQEIVDYFDDFANGDLSEKRIQSLQSNYQNVQDEFGDLVRTIISVRQNLHRTVSQVCVSSEQLAAASEEQTASSDQSSQASNQVAASIADVAKGAEKQLDLTNKAFNVVQQMSASVQQVSANANDVAAQSTQAVDKANFGNQSIEKAIEQMVNVEQTVATSSGVITKLGERSKEIGLIVDTIAGIAGQTNLLALNAAIEAARAGEQGRGFAVVAEEVRKLAEQSQQATEQIAKLISEIQFDTDKAVISMVDGMREVKLGSEIVNTAGTSFYEIANLISQVSEETKKISIGMGQIATNSETIVFTIKEINELSKNATGEAQNVSAATEEQLASIEEIASSSQVLANMGQDLQNSVNRFKI
ncbi:MAG: methyl-accepting chemotaxis protein [Sporomusaceae bacterium]|nr:methyl-accepting chemotaxis protein [Sporomusaceae bacterium]